MSLRGNNKQHNITKKLSTRYEDMFESGNFDETFINLSVDKQITNKLYKYQVLHLNDLIVSLSDNQVAIDGSGTGTGKTFVSIALCKHFKLTPIIICTKSVISMWKEVCKTFDIVPELVVNYETIKKGNQYVKNEQPDIQSNLIGKQSNLIGKRSSFMGKREECVYLKIDKKTDKFEWNIDSKKHIVIFDEAHKCKSEKTQNGKMLLSLKGKAKVLLLSATLADSPDNFFVYGFMLNLFKTGKQCRTLVADIIKNGKNSMSKINPLNDYLFPKYGSVMYLSESETELPRNIISATCYDIEKADEQELAESLEILKKNNNLEITKMLHVRQKIELIKVPIILELTNKYLEYGKSVVIFVNFLETLDLLAGMLNTTSVINGNQEMAERDKNIELFQKNKSKLLICTLQSGGQSISLHDTTGRHPRVSIIVPSYSSTDFVQALGRIHRAGTKSYCVQHIIFCANTQEEHICQKIKNKINFLTDLTDDDLDFNVKSAKK